MTYNQIKYAVKIAQKGSLSAAAEDLFVSQPSLTKAISDLEKDLNICIFNRNNRGVSVTREGELFLTYATQLLERTQYIEDLFKGGDFRNPVFSVSCQHYSFAVTALVDTIKKFNANQYDFTIRETKTYEIIEDVSTGKSELGIIYISKRNKELMQKLFTKNNLSFKEVFVAKAHVFISDTHPLAKKKSIKIEELLPYPYLTFEQGDFDSIYYSEELLSTEDIPKNIKVNDRATLFNLLIGLDGYTVSSGIINSELNGKHIVSVPLNIDSVMHIGYIYQNNRVFSDYAESYIEFLVKHCGQIEKDF